MFRHRPASALLQNGRLDAYFVALDRLGEMDLRRMRAAWKSMAPQEHEDAWTAVRTAGALNGIGKDIDRVRNRAMAWATRGNNAVPFQQDNTITWAQVKLEAAEAIVDVALGIALGDLLDEKSRSILLAAWDGAL